MINLSAALQNIDCSMEESAQNLGCSGMRLFRRIVPCCLPFGKAGELQILCCQGIKVTDYNFTLDTSRKAGFHI
jgi:hypothetical protein